MNKQELEALILDLNGNRVQVTDEMLGRANKLLVKLEYEGTSSIRKRTMSHVAQFGTVLATYQNDPYTVIFVEYGGIVGVGVARRWGEDVWDEGHGRDIAFKRAAKEIARK
ncbi:MAG: hypothetical protein KKH61_20175, partial [Gammaproteobacteria bacterium]|nr:hypothetical protein [Gammaproteobacteria bacterium]